MNSEIGRFQSTVSQLTLILRRMLRAAGLGLSIAAAGFPTVLAGQDAPQGQPHPEAARIHEFMSLAARYGQFNGAILVVDGGETVYEGAFGLANIELGVPNTTTTRFEIASMTKSMTAIAIMQLVQEGRVRLDAKVSDYLPFYPRETGTRITVEQLLNHTSGIRQDIAFDEPSPPRRA